MCGRVAVKYDADWLRRRYGTVNPPVNFAPNVNGAPTEQLNAAPRTQGLSTSDLPWYDGGGCSVLGLGGRCATSATTRSFRRCSRVPACLSVPRRRWGERPGSMSRPLANFPRYCAPT